MEKTKMSKIELIKKVINKEVTDYVPFSFKSHLPEVDHDPVKYAQALAEKVHQYDLDYAGHSSNGLFTVEDYVDEVDHSPVYKGGVSIVVKTPYNQPADLKKLPHDLDISTPSYQRELKSLTYLLDRLGDQVPVTVISFSPLTILDKLTKGRAVEFIRSGENELLHQTLENLTNVQVQYVQAALDLGAAGVYLASQFIRYDRVTKEEYLEFGKPYDLKILEAAKAGWFNSFHAHGTDIMFDLIKDYPIQVFNWHAFESLPSVEEVFKYSDFVLNCGVDRFSFNDFNRNLIRNQIYQIYKATKGQRLLFSPSCGTNSFFDPELIYYIKEVKAETDRIFNLRTEA